MNDVYEIKLCSMGAVFPSVMRETYFNRAVKRAVALLLLQPAASEALICYRGETLEVVTRNKAAVLVDNWAEDAAYV